MVGLRENGDWKILANRKMRGAVSEGLNDVISQELQSAGIGRLLGRLHVVALNTPAFDTSTIAWPARQLSLKALKGFSPIEDSQVAMALCGAIQ
jgi:hypothetical protein